MDLIFQFDLNVVMFKKKERLNKLSKNIFELSFYQDQKESKYKLTAIGISKNNSDSC